MRILGSLVAAGVGLLAMVAGASAQTAYPERSVRLVVAYGAGGPTDAFGRYVAQRLTTLWGQPVVVENRPGAATTVALRAVASAEPDGYTLLFGTAMGQPLLADIPADQIPGLDDFTPIVQTGVTAMHIVVRNDLNVNGIQDLVELVRARPGELNYGASPGSPPYMAFERFRLAGDLDMVMVPLTGSAAQVNGLLTNTIQIGIVDTQSAVTASQTGIVKSIAVIGSERAELLPDVMPLSEQGFEGISVVPWYGLLGPKGLSDEIRDKIEADVLKLLDTDEAREDLRRIGFEARLGGPDVLTQTVTDEIESTRRGIEELGSSLNR